MPVGLTEPGPLLPVAGVRLSTTAAGLRYQGRDDVCLMELAPGARTAAVFTRNAFCAAPVILARQNLAATNPRYLLINSGFANAGTGEAGMADARACCAALATQAGCGEAEVLPFSTGVIGQRLPVDKLVAALPAAASNLDGDRWNAASRAIMTTDTIAKGLSVQGTIAGEKFTITGIAKGAGMIRPDMATMLAYVATDVDMPADLLQRALEQAVANSFHRITVDGDTSTNDACVLVATGQGRVKLSAQHTVEQMLFQQALQRVMTHLAQAIVRDAEGAHKFVSIRVNGARDLAEADAVAFTIAHSPLVKTALSASDPNWGRILAAAGRAGVENLDQASVDLWLGGHLVAKAGALYVDYTEAQGQQAMAGEEIDILLDLHRGEASTVAWTSDLSHEYVTINASYRS